MTELHMHRVRFRAVIDDAAEPVPAQRVFADFDWTDAGLEFTFEDTSTSFDTIVSWLWDFGDGDTSTDQNPVHTYAVPGDYDVTLTVTTDIAESDDITQTVAAEEPVTNDDFENAFVLVGSSGTTTGNNEEATREDGEPWHVYGTVNRGINSLWWVWTAPFTGTITFDTDGSDIDSLLSIYQGLSVDALTEIVSNDDGDDISPASLVEFACTEDEVYYICVSSFRLHVPEQVQDIGDITLNWY